MRLLTFAACSLPLNVDGKRASLVRLHRSALGIGPLSELPSLIRWLDGLERRERYVMAINHSALRKRRVASPEAPWRPTFTHAA
jgi:hypothetical protein